MTLRFTENYGVLKMEFHDDDDLAGPDQVLVLSDGFATSKSFFDRIAKQVKATLPTLKRGRRHKSNDLYGKALWKKLDDGDKRLAGRCIARMVTTGDLPLVFVEGKHEYPKRYLLK